MTAGDPTTDKAECAARAAAGVEALQRWYVRWPGLPATGQWRTTGWWNAANALTAVIRYTQHTGDDRYTGAIERTFRAAGRRNPGFINKFFDDNAWWALAWMDAYDLTGHTRYLEAARVIFDNFVTAWDDTCGGGVWWNTDRKYKNAITNELFLAVAARLHQRVPGNDRYLDWAQREWAWFAASGMVNDEGLVNDGLTADCRNNGQPTYTYNQGVVLGGLAALYEITGDEGYLRAGEPIADATLRLLTSPVSGSAVGVLVEPGETAMAAARTRGDRTQFKGIFARNLADFARHSGRPAYRDFILRNAESVWTNSRNGRNQLGLQWTGPFDTADASRQSSALDVLVAAAALTS